MAIIAFIFSKFRLLRPSGNMEGFTPDPILINYHAEGKKLPDIPETERYYPSLAFLIKDAEGFVLYPHHGRRP